MTKLIYFIFIISVLCASAINPLYPADDENIDDLIDNLDKKLKPAPVEEKTDIIDTLAKVVDLMESAEDRLSSASNWTPSTKTDTATAEPQRSPDNLGAEKRQQEALDELNKLFDQIKKLQSEASQNLKKVIDSAVIMEPKGSSSGKKPKPKPKPKPQPQPKDKSDQDPAPRAYDAKADLPDPYTPRKSDGKKWGNLPPKLRDEIIQSAQEEFLPEYQDRLSRYYKILAGEADTESR
ncbi:MAG: hypothetical protein HZA49_01940 [Planctomycetes bacterium]|nr:hypothetical protein [Planctomycetota bacterium]